MRRLQLLACIAVASQPFTGYAEGSSEPVRSKWSGTIYGFAELDAITDSSQSFTDLAGNAGLAPRDTFGANHGRATISARNSRFGLRFAAPEAGAFHVSGMVEADFFGNQPPNASESAFFTNPTLRLRHAMVKVETPVVDVLLGQYWQLFGWQPMFHPNTVDLQGLPGQVFGRTPQLRLSRTFTTGPLGVELAVAAARPPQRDAGLPDGQAGARFMLNGWKGVHTLGATGTTADPLAVGISGAARRFELQRAASDPDHAATAHGWGYSLDALLPVIPAALDARGNALTLTGSFVRGDAIADLYTALTGGFASSNAFAGGTATSPAIDPGLVVQDASGALRAIQWRSFIVGAQYYLPPSGSMWLSVTYSQMDSYNAVALAGPNASKIFKQSRFGDVNVFWDATAAVRLGLEYARFEQTYADATKRSDNRYQLSAFYIF